MHRRPQFRSTSLLFFTMASLFLVSLLLLLLSLSLPLSITSRRPHYPRPIRPITSSSSSIVQQACKATRFPSTCISTLSDLKTSSTPTDLILSSVAASFASLATARSNAKAIFDASSDDPDRTNAANNCIEHLRYSSHRLGQVSIAVSGSRIADAMAWTSAALLYQYDCFSALKYVNGTKQVDDAMWYMISLSNLTSNALSLLFSYWRFGNDTSRWIQPQTERDGYWGDSLNVVGGESGRSLRVGLLPVDRKENPNARVCKEGGQGNCYRTVQDAVNSAPDFGGERYVIYIMTGVYEETVRVPLEKTNLVFVGDGMGKTVITGSLNAQMVGVTTYNTATVGVNGDGFMAKDLTIENTAGPDAHQAVAFRSDSDLSFLQNVEFLGHQDTLYAHSLRQFYMSCRITGTVDFVFGNSATVFQDCLLLVRPRQLAPEKGKTNAVTAQGRTDPAQSTGFVFNNCSVDGTEDYMVLYHRNPAKHKNYLGRPWKEYSRTVFIQCYLGELVRPEGWLPWSGNFALSTLFYGEYESSGPGANSAGRVKWSNQILAEHVGVYSIQNFIQGGAWIPAGVV